MIDEIDHRILSELQKNAHLTSYELSEKLNLSQSQAGRRRQRLEREGYIKSYRAEINGKNWDCTFRHLFKCNLQATGRNKANNLLALCERVRKSLPPGA